MSNIVVASPFELPGVLASVADKLGGQPYREKAISAFVLSREIRPHQPNCDSYVKFGAEHKLPDITEDQDGRSYHIERGDRRDVAAFSREVLDVFAEDGYRLPPSEGLWEEDVTSVTVALEEGCETVLFIAAKNKRYGVDDDMLMDVPVLGETPIFVEPEDMDPAADFLASYQEGNLLVMELMQIGAVPLRQSFGELDALLLDFGERTRPEQLTAEIEMMLNAMMPE